MVFIAAFILLLASSIGLVTFFIKEKTIVVPARGGNYTEGVLGQPAHINPVTASSEADKSLVRLLFSNLSAISDKITVDKTGKNWNIRLKENIRWSDGEKLTSDDVIFTIQKIQDPDSGSPISSSWQSIGVNRISELELGIALGSPYSFFSENLKQLYIIPKHLFAETPVANWRLSRYNLQPVGSGPYAFDSYETRRDGFITAYHLKTNKFYFATRPLITEFSLRFFSNAAEMINVFNSGQIDGFAIDSGQAGDIKRPYEAHNFFLSSYYAAFFNQGQNLALQDKKVRQALSIAVNRRELVDEILKGNGEIRLGPISMSLLQNSVDQAGNFSTEIANQILDSDGWLAGSSTIRQKTIKNSKINLELNLLVPQISFLQKTAEILQIYWANIGVKTNIVALQPEDISGETVKNRNYQVILFGNMLNPPTDLFVFWHSTQIIYPGLNLSLYNSKQADNLITGIDRGTDNSKRPSDIQGIQDLIAGDYPAAFLYSPYYVYFSIKDLQGIQAGLINEPAERFNNVANWYLKTTRSLK